MNARNIFRLLAAALIAAASIITMKNSSQTVYNNYYAVSAGKKLPIYCVETSGGARRQAAITFNAAWGAEGMDEILRILAERAARATFFLCGYWIEQFPEEARRIRDAGHDIANHGDTHAHVAKLSLEQNLHEILDAHAKAKNLLGVEMNLFRPPFGEYNNTVLEAAEAAGYYAIQWDVDSHDWMNKGVDYEINQVLNHKHLGSGSIILFHCGARDTPAALPLILDGLAEKGYEFVTVSELIHTQNFYMDHEGRQRLNK
ncbi:MAG: polysaccharide deacetylase family protein [Clostridiales bacterium]|jgi:polysaccharide deacetylase family sporulation protein PdaB|nr:polysaccharide deacetylase family protein [Clostridiales bacterium]